MEVKHYIFKNGCSTNVLTDGKVLIDVLFCSVFTNGNYFVPPVRLLIPKYSLKNWEIVLAMITEKVRLRTGAVRRYLK